MDFSCLNVVVIVEADVFIWMDEARQNNGCTLQKYCQETSLTNAKASKDMATKIVPEDD